MSRTQKILFFATGWLIVLMPFLFWWNTWFGRHLSDQQLTEYLHDDKKPRHIQQALVQIGDRMSHHDAASNQWYPELVRWPPILWKKCATPTPGSWARTLSGAGFHEALLKMLTDPSPMVRGNAALSLVRFGDATGRPQIVALLQPAHDQPLLRMGTSWMPTVPALRSTRADLLAKLERNRSRTSNRNSLSDSRAHSFGRAAWSKRGCGRRGRGG